MKFFNKRKSATEEKKDISTGVVHLPSGSLSGWNARNPALLIKTGYAQNPIAFRAVRLISEAASTVKWHFQDHEMRYDQHPILDLLTKPNSSQTSVAFFETLYGNYLLYGQAYLEAQIGEDDGVEALYLLRPDRVRVLLGQDGWPEAYEYKVGRHKALYGIGDGFDRLFQIRSFHPQDDHYGLSPIHAAASAIDVHNAAGAWSKSLLDNAARPSGAIVYRGAEGMGHLSEQQFLRLKDEIETYHQGARNAGRPMLLEGGLDWKPMGFSPSDMEFHRTKDTAAREIALAFGVPPMLLGIPGDNTYSNYQEANRAFYRLTILPLVERVLSEIQGWLLAEETTSIVIDMESIPALAFERESDWRRVVAADFLDAGEKRKLLGFPEKTEQADA